MIRARPQPRSQTALLRTAWLLYHIRPLLSSGFWKVFLLFCGIFRRPTRSQLAHYSTFVFICQQLFWKFFRFGNTSKLVQTWEPHFVQLYQQFLLETHTGSQRSLFTTVFPVCGKNSSKFVITPFTITQKCGILLSVKITERQMRWVKLSRIEYFPFLRATMPSALSRRAYFLPVPIRPQAGRRYI